MSKAVNLDLEPGEAFFRVSVGDDGATNFACGFYPSNVNIEKDFDPESDIDYDDMLAVFMAGIAYMVQEDMDTILRYGMEYVLKGGKPFDFVVSPTDVDYYEDLSDEQLQLLRMDAQGEA